MPARHHFVPQFYLRRFSNARNQIRVYTAGTTAEPKVMSIKNAAVETGFYTAAVHEGGDPEGPEKLLSRVEAQAKRAIENILGGQFPPSLDDRKDMALFLAFQLLRTPESRMIHQMSVDALMKLSIQGLTRREVRDIYVRGGVTPKDEKVNDIFEALQHVEDFQFHPHKNDDIVGMMDVAPRGALLLIERTWALGVSNEPLFVTSDHPLITCTVVENHALLGLGLLEAEECFFPLDPRHILVLLRPAERPRAEKLYNLDFKHVSRINHAIASFAHRYVFQHPDQVRIDKLILEEPRVIAHKEIIKESVRDDAARMRERLRGS